MPRKIAPSKKCPGQAADEVLEWVDKVAGSGVHRLTPGTIKAVSRAVVDNHKGKGADIDFEDWYQRLILVRDAHRVHRSGKVLWRDCVKGCSISYVGRCGDAIILLASGMIKKYARGGGSAEAEAENERHLQVVLAEAIESYDASRGVKFIFYVHEQLRKAAPSPSLSEGGETNYKVATACRGRERGLTEELGRDPSERELYESTRDWFFAVRVSKERGEDVEITTREQIAEILGSATEEELATARVRLSRDGILSWFDSVSTFQAAIGRANVKRLDAPLGESSEGESDRTLAETIADKSIGELYESDISDMDRLLGLTTGRIDNVASAISMKIQDTHRHTSYESVAASTGVEDVGKIKVGVRDAKERSASPIYQYAWLSTDLSRQMVSKGFGAVEVALNEEDDELFEVDPAEFARL